MGRMVVAVGMLVFLLVCGSAVAGVKDAPRDEDRVLQERAAEQARVTDVKIVDRQFRAGEMLRERKEVKLERRRLREREAAETKRRARIERQREVRRARSAFRARLKKKRRIR